MAEKQTYQDILDDSSGKGSAVEEGFQKIWLKEIKVTDFDSKYHDVGLDIVVAPEDYPDWKINQTIWGDWNLNSEYKPTIWKVAGVLDAILKELDKKNIEAKVLFDTAVEPPELVKDHIEALNDEFDKLPMYGYLYQGRRKKSDANILFWQVHNYISNSHLAKKGIVRSFKGWKQNDKVQQHWIFEEDEDDTSFDFGSNVDKEQQDEPVEEENSFLGI